MYSFFTGKSQEVIIADSTSRKINKIYDQSLSGNDAGQSNNLLQPLLCAKAERINNRYYLKFDGTKRMISDINLSPRHLQRDTVNAFIVYRLITFDTNTYWLRSGLFGHDNRGFDKFIAFLPSPSKDLVISYGGDYATIGPTSGSKSIGTYKNKTNCSNYNLWICLSIHWKESAGNNGSSVYCNGQKMGVFTTKTTKGSNQTTFRDLSPSGIAPLNGDIALFILYRNEMEESDILLHHKCICNNWLNIDHEPINI